MRFVFEQSAEPHELFAPGCLDEAVGREIPIRGPKGETLGTGTLVGYEVIEDGEAMRLTVDVEEEGAENRLSGLLGVGGDLSVGSRNGGVAARGDGGYRGPGRYLHYKGGEYEVLGLALREDSVVKRDDGTADGTGERFVVYRPLTPGSLLWTEDYDDCEFWARELGDFDATVLHEGVVRPRFVLAPDREGDDLLVRAARFGDRLIRTAIDLATKLRPRS